MKDSNQIFLTVGHIKTIKSLRALKLTMYEHRQLVVSIPRLSASSRHLMAKINTMGTIFYTLKPKFDWLRQIATTLREFH